MAVRTAVLMLNLGGPRNHAEVRNYFVQMFSDRTFIPLPFGLGPIIGARRAKSRLQQYVEIGFSPLEKWTNLQGLGMTALLNQQLPQHAPFKHYCAFRYSEPSAQSAVQNALSEGAERIILFTQYPHYSCASTGNSLRDALAAVPESERNKVSVVHRWPTSQKFVAAWKGIVTEELKKFGEKQEDVPIVFSAHSLPASVVWSGDIYPYEIGSTVNAIMSGLRNPYSLSWQSRVGLQTWLQPATHTTLIAMAKQGHKNVLVVPIAFTSDHIETLYELDREVIPEAKASGLTGAVRCAAPNDNPNFISAIAEVVADHIKGSTATKIHRCVKCRFPQECQKLWPLDTSFHKD